MYLAATTHQKKKKLQKSGISEYEITQPTYQIFDFLGRFRSLLIEALNGCVGIALLAFQLGFQVLDKIVQLISLGSLALKLDLHL